MSATHRRSGPSDEKSRSTRAVDGAGNVYVAGRYSHNVVKITPAGAISEIIDSTGDGGGNVLDEPFDVAVGSGGNACLGSPRTSIGI